MQSPSSSAPASFGNRINRLFAANSFGWILAFGAVVLFSTNSPIGRAVILEGVNPTLLLMLRFAGSALIAGLSFVVTDWKLLKIGRKHILKCAAFGLLAATTTLTYYFGLSRVSASITAMIVSLYPLVVLVSLAMRGEPLTRRNIVRLALGVGGIYLLIGPGGEVDFIGLLLIIATVLQYGAYLVLIQWYMGDYNTRVFAFYNDMTVAICMAIFTFVQGVQPRIPSAEVGWLIVAMAIGGTFIARNMSLRGIQLIGSGQTALFGPIETMLVIVWSILFLNETLLPLQWFGALLILGSTLLVFENRPKWLRRRTLRRRP